jgi:NAD(P)-dependent dehydrogenase (short-subunit alcohol dehydrogenase family)
VLGNAGILSISPRTDVDQDALFREVVDINLTGVWNTVSAAAPAMIEQGAGDRSCSRARRKGSPAEVGRAAAR